MQSHVASLFKAFRENETSELEISINQKGERGVPFEAFESIYDLLCNWVETKQLVYCGYKRVKDFFYHNSLRSRVIIGFEDDNITKTKIASIHAKCPERKFAEFFINLKDEVPYIQPIAFNNEPIDVRIFHFWEFEDKDTFKYSLKQVQSGKTVEDACKNDIKYEIEIEINRNSEYLKSHSDDEMAINFIERALDLTGRKNATTGQEDILKMELFSEKRKKDPNKIQPKRKYVSKKVKKEQEALQNK